MFVLSLWSVTHAPSIKLLGGNLLIGLSHHFLAYAVDIPLAHNRGLTRHNNMGLGMVSLPPNEGGMNPRFGLNLNAGIVRASQDKIELHNFPPN
jgi:hypothetical protein